MSTEGHGAREETDGAGMEAGGERQGILREFVSFLLHEKKWWLVPLLVVLGVLVAVMVFMESSSLAPFIYPLF